MSEPYSAQNITWPSASGNVTSISIGGEMFVPMDWNAYDRGYEACKSDAVEVLREQCLCGLLKQGKGCYCDVLVFRAIEDIQALPPKESTDE
jgi:hypothetical protein